MPVQLAAVLFAGPSLDGADQSPGDALASSVGRCEQILQVAEIGPGRAGVDQEMGDADESAVEPGSERVHPVALPELLPGLVVPGRGPGPFVKVVVAAKKIRPGWLIRWLQRG